MIINDLIKTEFWKGSVAKHKLLDYIHGIVSGYSGLQVTGKGFVLSEILEGPCD